MRRVLILLGCAAGLFACSRERLELAQDAQSYMVGLSKDEVQGCMGPPSQTTTQGSTEVWSFEPRNGGLCTVSVVILGDRVSQVDYLSPTGERIAGGQCSVAVRNCMHGLTGARRSIPPT
jgi:hypothetical protein